MVPISHKQYTIISNFSNSLFECTLRRARSECGCIPWDFPQDDGANSSLPFAPVCDVLDEQVSLGSNYLLIFQIYVLYTSCKNISPKSALRISSMTRQRMRRTVIACQDARYCIILIRLLGNKNALLSKAVWVSLCSRLHNGEQVVMEKIISSAHPFP